MKFLLAPALEWVYRGRDFRYDVVSIMRTLICHKKTIMRPASREFSLEIFSFFYYSYINKSCFRHDAKRGFAFTVGKIGTEPHCLHLNRSSIHDFRYDPELVLK